MPLRSEFRTQLGHFSMSQQVISGRLQNEGTLFRFAGGWHRGAGDRSQFRHVTP
jgi:hypothetical protein